MSGPGGTGGTNPGRYHVSEGMTPTNVHGYERYDLARSYFEDGQYAKAASELEELLTDVAAARAHLDSSGQGAESSHADPVGHGLSEARLLLARAYFHTAQLGRAERAARDVIAESPQDAYAYLLLGRSLQRAGRRDEARGPLRLAQLLGGYDIGDAPSADVMDQGI